MNVTKYLLFQHQDCMIPEQDTGFINSTQFMTDITMANHPLRPLMIPLNLRWTKCSNENFSAKTRVFYVQRNRWGTNHEILADIHDLFNYAISDPLCVVKEWYITDRY